MRATTGSTSTSAATSRWPRWLRREPMELAACALIGTGVLMLMQPWSLEIYSYSFAVLLAGVAGYTVAGKLPSDG